MFCIPQERAIAVAPLTFHLETMGPLRLPDYAGALFRGGFGKFFRDLACTTRLPVCAGCGEVAGCSYAQVFESPVDPSRFTVLRKYPNAPHPFVLTPPLDQRSVVPAGERVALQVALIGPGVKYLPHFIRILDAMGKGGDFGGRFRVARVVSGVQPSTEIYDGGARKFVGELLEWAPGGEVAGAKRIRLDFVTPLRMRVGGRYEVRPSFVDVAQSLLRRIHLLSAIYGEGGPEAEWMHPLLAVADGARTTKRDFEVFRWDRMSGRQGRRIEMDGVTGTVEAEGDLGALVPYFRLGKWLHVGSGTSMGLGRYEMEVEELCSV
jgi:CRISPR/Cas system endoribonuclease Cas6 (RAMP superfamily)